MFRNGIQSERIRPSEICFRITPTFDSFWLIRIENSVQINPSSALFGLNLTNLGWFLTNSHRTRFEHFFGWVLNYSETYFGFARIEFLPETSRLKKCSESLNWVLSTSGCFFSAEIRRSDLVQNCPKLVSHNF